MGPTITKATKPAIKATKKAAGKAASKANGKKMAAAMKKKGVGIFAPKTLSSSLASICGKSKMPHRSNQGHLGLHQEELVEQRPHHQAGRGAQGHLPGREPRYAQDALVHLQALVLRPWGAPATQPKSSDVAPGSGVAAARVALVY